MLRSDVYFFNICFTAVGKWVVGDKSRGRRPLRGNGSGLDYKYGLGLAEGSRDGNLFSVAVCS